MSLLEKISVTRDDRVVAVGDLTVKGNKSREVLDLFNTDDRFSSVVGNHDLALIRYWRGDEVTLKKPQEQTRLELEVDKSRYFKYLSSLPFTIDLGSYLVVHAGLRPGVPLGRQSPEDLTELRTLGPDPTSREGVPWYDVYQGEKIVLFGHWPARIPRRGKQALGLDTGCVYGGLLTGYIVETEELVSVSALDVYQTPKVPLSSGGVIEASLLR